MAEFGAHITSISQEDEAPSIFDVLAQDNLMQLLQPAIKHVFKVLAENNPSRFGWLHQLGDEIYTVFHLILENHYLRHCNASFAENFYGLKRETLSNALKSGKLTTSSHIKSLMFLVLVPYMKQKCNHYFETLQAEGDTMHSNYNNLKQKLIKAFLTVYPIVHLMWEGSMFVYQFLFIIKKSRYHSPYLPLAGVQLAYLSQDDIAQQNSKREPVTLKDKRATEQLNIVLKKSLGIIAVSLSNGLSVGAFFLQFLDWWYASDERTVSITALPIPNPPQALKRENVPGMTSMCPLCYKLRTNDTALAVSGFVFCYPCIHNYIKENKACPITGYPANSDHLIKLYLPDE